MSYLQKGILFMAVVAVVMIVVPMLEHGMSFSDAETVALAAVGLFVGVFGGVAFAGLWLVVLVATAGSTVKRDSVRAMKMGEQGVNTRLFGILNNFESEEK